MDYIKLRKDSDGLYLSLGIIRLKEHYNSGLEIPLYARDYFRINDDWLVYLDSFAFCKIKIPTRLFARILDDMYTRNIINNDIYKYYIDCVNRSYFKKQRQLQSSQVCDSEPLLGYTNTKKPYLNLYYYPCYSEQDDDTVKISELASESKGTSFLSKLLQCFCK